jgi:hypothetical protein
MIGKKLASLESDKIEAAAGNQENAMPTNHAHQEPSDWREEPDQKQSTRRD